MKIIIFTVCVLLSGYYLVSQTETGSTLLSRYLPQQEIEKTAVQVKDKVDQNIEHLAQKYMQPQNDKIAKLESKVIALEKMLQANQSLESKSLPETVEIEHAPEVKHTPTLLNDGVVQLSPLIENHQPSTEIQTFDEFAQQRNITKAPKEKIRKQQAMLDDIANRMEVVSLQASRGSN